MGKNKPVLKRSIPRSSYRRPNRLRFAITVLLVLFFGWTFFKIAFHPQQKKEAPKKAAVQHKASPAQKQAPLPKPFPPENMEIEKDSMTFPEQAPRMEHREPVLMPVDHRKLDWKKPTIVFVIDDIGHERSYDKLMDILADKITYAILPYLKYSHYYGEKSRQTGADVILHLPLESELGIYPGPGLITRHMPEDEIRRMVNEQLDSIPHTIGANNHMGSLGTSDPVLMQTILQEFKRRNLFFLDSFTSSHSHVVPISRQLHIPVLRRDVFLDNVEQPGPIREQVMKTAQVAKKSGFAIAIGHYKKYTLEVLVEEIPKLERQGFQIVKLSDLMRRYN